MAKAKAKPKKKAAVAAAKTRDPLVVGSKVKEAIKGHGLMMSGELLAELNCKVYCLLDKAAKRATENGRKTVQARDL